MRCAGRLFDGCWTSVLEDGSYSSSLEEVALAGTRRGDGQGPAVASLDLGQVGRSDETHQLWLQLQKSGQPPPASGTNSWHRSHRAFPRPRRTLLSAQASFQALALSLGAAIISHCCQSRAPSTPRPSVLWCLSEKPPRSQANCNSCHENKACSTKYTLFPTSRLNLLSLCVPRSK